MHVGQKIGPFTIEKELGSGAMGTVYRAKLVDPAGDKIVALKVIAFGLSSNESALARFEREANILKQLKHPNIVRLMATGRYKGTPFFAMEYINGQSLDHVMADRSQGGAPLRAPFTWEEVVEFGKQLCGALQHAHEKGIIHRDLKPSNLMLTEEGILKLTDFGIAKDVDVTALTGANNTIGTAAYMSPEQCKGEKHLTGKSDIYSLGVVFYELLTGRKPFQAESSVDMFLMHVNGKFIRPAQLNPEIPIWLDTLICQMMEKRPEDRPRDASMVGQVLDEIYEKVTAQKSAGADVAGARAVDRVHLTDAPSKDDLHAAKAIRAGSRKKKLRKKKQAIYTKGWFVTLACIALVATFGTVIYFAAFAPPSAEALLKRIENSSDDAKVTAISEYLRHYGETDDETTRKVRGIERDEKVRKNESVLLNRHGRENLRGNPREGDDPDAYSKTMLALSSEKEGDIANAKILWQELADKFASDSNSDKAFWGWHAKKKLGDLAFVEQWVPKTVEMLKDKFQWNDLDIEIADEIEKQAVNAYRLETLGDTKLAYERWELLKKSCTDAAKRSWYLLAGKQVRDLDSKKSTPKDTTERAKLLRGIIDRVKVTLASDEFATRRNGRNVLRDIRDLYAGDSDLTPLVNEAKKLLKDTPK